jgi:hypothetical protein
MAKKYLLVLGALMIAIIGGLLIPINMNSFYKISTTPMWFTADWASSKIIGDFFYTGSISNDGNTIYAIKYDTKSQVLLTQDIIFSSNNGNDPGHYAPGFWMDSSGYMYMTCGYSESEAIMRKSTYPYDITYWGPEKEITHCISYPFIWTDSLNNIYVIGRSYESNFWDIYRSSNDGNNWNLYAHTIWPSGNNTTTCFYLRILIDISTGRLHTAAVGTRDDRLIEKRNNLYYAYSEDNGANWKNIDGSVPRNVNETIIYTGKTSRVDLAFDSIGYPILTHSLGYLGVGEVYLHKWNGTGWVHHLIIRNPEKIGWDAICNIHGTHQKADGIIEIYLSQDGGLYRYNSNGIDLSNWSGERLSKSMITSTGNGYFQGTTLVFLFSNMTGSYAINPHIRDPN